MLCSGDSAEVSHLFSFRTESLSPRAAMVVLLRKSSLSPEQSIQRLIVTNSRNVAQMAERRFTQREGRRFKSCHSYQPSFFSKKD